MLTRLLLSIILIFYTEVASTSTLLITVITFVTTILFDYATKHDISSMGGFIYRIIWRCSGIKD